MKPPSLLLQGLSLAALLLSAPASGVFHPAQAATVPAAGRNPGLPALFEASPLEARPRRPLPSGARALGRVKARADLLEGLAPDRPHRLGLALGAGRRFTASLERSTRYHARTRAWSGSVEELPGSTLTLVAHNGVVAMELMAPGQPTFVLRHDGEGDPLLCEQGFPAGNFCAPTRPKYGRPPASQARGLRPDPAPERIGRAAPSSAAPAAEGPSYDAARVDVAIVYTPVARDAAGGQNAIQATIYAYFTAMNDAHWASRTATNFRLVHLAEVEYFEEGNLDDHVERLEETDEAKNSYAPVFRAVHEARLREGADLVSLFVDDQGSRSNSGTLGVAFRDWPFSCLKWNSSSVVITHELGHCLGLCHQEADTPDCDGSFAYSHAWRAQHDYLPTYSEYVSTVMWSFIGPGEKNVLRFSNPEQAYTLRPVSPYSPVTVPLGNPDRADNARTLREKGYLSALYLNPRLYVSTAGEASNPATQYQPQVSVFNAVSYWYQETLAFEAGWMDERPPLLKVAPGTYREPAMRLDQPLRVERWGAPGTARIQLFSASPTASASASPR